WPDRAVRAATDALLAMPPLLLQLVVAGVVHPLAGARVAWMVALLAATGWMGVARVTRAQVAALSQAGFVTAARAVGLSEAAIVRHHVLPHVAPYALTWAAMGASQALVAEASLSYLGLGLEAPWISWGSMLRDWGVGDPAHELAAPALAILVTSVSWALLADALARALDRRDG
ncbi:MAG TPA: ABC transporter permease subunit, partial [Myxococcota bacterium]|nr:ABC transporter permease subunit [Myxococcota bacterium]